MFVERTFTVAKPVEEVFAFLGDFTSTNQWDPGTKHTERTSGDGGLGTTYSNVSTFMGRTVTLRYETITYKVPTQVQFRGQNGGTSATDSMTFTRVDDATTRVHYRADFAFSPALRLFAPVVIGRRLSTLADDTVTQIQRCLR